MTYRCVILPSALRELKSLPNHIRRQVDARILALADNARPSGCKALKGIHRGLYRIRSGDYRIVYRVQDKELLISIVRVGNRKDVYE